MGKSESALGIFFRIPELGKVKRRLAKQIGDEEALKVYQAMLIETMKNVQKLEGINLYGFYAGSLEPSLEFPSTISYIPQKGIDLGERMLNALAYLFEKGYKKVVLIGSDSPDLPIDYIKQAFQMFNKYALVIGPSKDGGYYLIGMNKPLNEIFKDIVWGSKHVFQDTLLKAKEANINFFLLPEWYDIDDLESLIRWMVGHLSKSCEK